MEAHDLQEELIADLVKTREADLGILREMMEAGLMYGHKKSKTNPKFKPYIFTTRNGVEIIDLDQTLTFLGQAIEFLKNQVKEGKLVLLAAIQPAAREAIKRLAEKLNFPYTNEKWIGGLLTNFKVISQRLEYFKKVQADFEKGEFGKYTKKERVMINRNIHRMKKMFTGLENLVRLPDVIFIIDTTLKGHTTAIREAKKMNIPIVAVVDSDDNPDAVNYPIPANDHSKISIDWLMSWIEKQLIISDL